jgi:hypothetical protein
LAHNCRIRILSLTSQGISDLLAAAERWPSGLAAEVREQKRILQLKHMLLSYGLTCVPVH